MSISVEVGECCCLISTGTMCNVPCRTPRRDLLQGRFLRRFLEYPPFEGL
ncbi:hypothetical protein SAMN05216332_101169 [Nitrosospira briensis]|nr:hypothetical protein SAMN05216332_101169 [Nitrosospira briensis]